MSNPRSHANRIASSDAVRGLVGKGEIVDASTAGHRGPLQALEAAEGADGGLLLARIVPICVLP